MSADTLWQPLPPATLSPQHRAAQQRPAVACKLLQTDRGAGRQGLWDQRAAVPRVGFLGSGFRVLFGGFLSAPPVQLGLCRGALLCPAIIQMLLLLLGLVLLVLLVLGFLLGRGSFWGLPVGLIISRMRSLPQPQCSCVPPASRKILNLQPCHWVPGWGATLHALDLLQAGLHVDSLWL